MKGENGENKRWHKRNKTVGKTKSKALYSSGQQTQCNCAEFEAISCCTPTVVAEVLVSSVESLI